VTRFGWCEGSFAEYASVPEGQLAPKPANLTFEQAAAVPISGFAALQALRDTGEVQPGPPPKQWACRHPMRLDYEQP
jgi:NADPH:quinone reductase-like Zn-dependent oxidoreductase